MLRVTTTRRTVRYCLMALGVLVCVSSGAVGTPAGTDISNTANVTYQIGPDTLTEASNAAVITVAEIIDVDVTLQSSQVPVEPSDTNEAVVFTVTNSGNGDETIVLSAQSTLPGDDFDPVLSTPDSVFFDTDGSGDFSAGDTAYVPGTNDPVLAPDESITVLVLNDIPAGLADGDLGQTQLTATADTGTGAPGAVVSGAGDGGVDAMIGSSEGEDDDIGEYIVNTITVSVVKSATVNDPFGGNVPVPGATIVYRLETTVVGTGTATAATVTDDVPVNTSYIPGSMVLNGTALSDAADGDAGEFDAAAGPTVSVDLGDLTDADGTQIVEFSVVID